MLYIVHQLRIRKLHYFNLSVNMKKFTSRKELFLAFIQT